MKGKFMLTLALSALCFAAFAGCGRGNGNNNGGGPNEPDPPVDTTLAENYDFGDSASWAGSKLVKTDLGDCEFDVFPEDHRYDWGQSIMYDSQEKIYKMWWCRHSRFDSIWYAESEDMKNWHDLQKVLVVEPGHDTTWIKMHVGKPAVIKVKQGEGYGYRMYFEAPATLRNGGGVEYNNNVFMATSEDGKAWDILTEKDIYPDRADANDSEPYPIIRMTDEEIAASNKQSDDRDSYGYYGFGQPSITQKDGVYYIYYTHSLTVDFMYVATSTDGIHFENHTQVFNRAASGVKYNKLLNKFMFTWTNDNKVWYMESDDGFTFQYANMTEAKDAETVTVGRSKIRGYSDFVSDELGQVTTHTSYCAYMEGEDPGNGLDFRIMAHTWNIHVTAFNVKEYANRTMVLPNGRVKTDETRKVYENSNFVYETKHDTLVKATAEKSELNGKKDEFYDGASELKIDRVSYSDYAVPGKISATVYAKYTNGYLYLLVAVQDETEDDSDWVDIMLDETHANGDTGAVTKIDMRRADKTAGITDNDGNTLAGETRYRQVNGGYNLEVKIPWRTDCVKAGGKIGFDCYVFNNYDSAEFKNRISYNESLLYYRERGVHTLGELTFGA